MTSKIKFAPRNTAFTLIELLIVIAIITVLIAILLPALRRARDQANSIACLSNLRQIATADAAYIADSGGYVVPAARVGLLGSPGDYTQIYSHDTWDGVFLYYGYIGGSAITNVAGNKVYTSGVLRCPSGLDNVYSGSLPHSPSMMSPSDANGSYPHFNYYTLINGSNYYSESWYTVNGITSDDQPGENADAYPSTLFPNFPVMAYPTALYNGTGGTVEGAAPYTYYTAQIKLRKYNQIVKATDLAFAFDGPAATLNIGGQSPTQFTFSARHINGTACNVVFFDGHAETLPDGATHASSAFPIPVNGSYFDGALGTYTWSTLGLAKNAAFPKWRVDEQ